MIINDSEQLVSILEHRACSHPWKKKSGKNVGDNPLKSKVFGERKRNKRGRVAWSLYPGKSSDTYLL
jgi:hypothetical protein